MTSQPAADPQRMHCMDVWGGNAPIQTAVETTGLQVWLHSQPFEQAEGGGDVYYISSCASGRVTRLLLADVSGHGEAVADLAVGLRDLMRRNINVVRQTRFVRAMNREFADQAGDEAFATATVSTFYAPTGSLQLCNAGHPPPMLFRAKLNRWISAGELAAVESGPGLADVPLGVVKHAEYSLFDTRLARGDMVLCVSDSFTEARSASGEMLGTEGLLRMVQGLDASRPGELISVLIDRVLGESRDNLSDDDTTALLFRVDGSRVTLKDYLLSPFLRLGRVHDKTVLQG